MIMMWVCWLQPATKVDQSFNKKTIVLEVRSKFTYQWEKNAFFSYHWIAINQNDCNSFNNLNIFKSQTYTKHFIFNIVIQSTVCKIRCNRAFKQKLIGCKLHCCKRYIHATFKIFLPMPLPINISIQPMNLLGQNRDKNIYLKCTNNRSHIETINEMLLETENAFINIRNLLSI